MPDQAATVVQLARSLISIDSRSFVSNRHVAECCERALTGFDIERLDYSDAAGVAKRALVARRGSGPCLALSGHLDTVPDTGWTDPPFDPRLENGRLHGLGSADMKGPVAACIVAATGLPPDVPVMLLLTTDEETTKRGAQEIATRSVLVREAPPSAILVAEPTGLVPVRGHRAHILFTAHAHGVQAHSSTGRGRNANWDLLPFLTDMRAVFDRLRSDPSLRDPAYDPPFSDFNLVVDNHGAAVNVTVPLATARIKFRYTASVDPDPIAAAVEEAARRAGVELTLSREGAPPELSADHPLVRLCTARTGHTARTAPYGTDASQLQAIAPCIVLGPGDIGQAHTPDEFIDLASLHAAVPMYRDLAERVASGEANELADQLVSSSRALRS